MASFPLSEGIITGQAAHADLHNEERDAINDLYVGKLKGVPATTLTSGSYCIPISAGAASTNAGLNDGVLRLAPVYLPALTIARVGVDVTGAGTAGCTLRLGIYNDDGGGRPGTLALDAGTVAGDAIATPEITLGTPLALAAGFYWLGGALQGSPASQPTVRTIIAQLPTPPGVLFSHGTSLPAAGATAVGVLQTGVSGALPASFTFGNASAQAMRLFFKLA